MRVFLGTYTDGGAFFPSSSGGGIMTCRLDDADGRFSELHSAARVTNPSWIHLADGGKRLFAVSELFDRPGEVHGFDLAEEGSLAHCSTQSSHGLATCHLTSTGTHLFAASYLDGRLSVYPRENGRVGEATEVVQYTGSGPNPDRQEAAHAHHAAVSLGGRWLYVCDLGADCIHQHELHDGALSSVRDIKVAPGAGPRHLVFHPSKPLAWAVCELTPLVLAFSWDAISGGLRLLQTLDMAGCPGLEDVGASAAIRLHPSGKLLGVSDRTTHSISLFHVADSGELTFRQRIRTTDESPRDFAFTPDGRWLLAAYQETHGLASHAIAADLQVSPIPADRLKVDSPVCIAIPAPGCRENPVPQ